MSSFHYKKPNLFFNAHIETIYPSVFRKVELLPYTRERISTPDHDFLDLDWIKQGVHRLVIISHGLEGNTQRSYIRGMSRVFFKNQYDVLAWNYRGCSEEMNHQRRFYHSGATDDLDCVIQHALSKKYTEIFLIGFSLGGNLTLKYLGESVRREEIKKAVVFSVPMDLRSSCEKISTSANFIYAHRFLRSLKEKIITKSKIRNDIDITNINSIKTLQEFDDRYTAEIHGYKNALDYYQQCSSIHYVSTIAIPTLIINAQNDPFLSKQCYPEKELHKHPNAKLETPLNGGHVGFTQFKKSGIFWSEERALHFINNRI